jgi:hypothetical protein
MLVSYSGQFPVGRNISEFEKHILTGGNIAMNRKIFLVFLASVVAFGIGCRTAQVYNVEKSPVTLYGDNQATMEQVEKAIFRAGAGLGWKIKTVSPGVMVGSLAVRRHVAIVDITYNTQEYNITYKDSTALKYDGTSIHSNYNGWVQNLDKAISAQLSTL